MDFYGNKYSVKSINNQSIKIGKISKKMEEAFNLAFASDINVYIRPAFLDALAARRPESYLKTIEEMKSIIKNPDIIYYSKDDTCFGFFRLYPSSSGFQVILIKVSPQGRPKVWAVEEMRRVGDAECKAFLKAGVFRRLK